jgi:outer membrane protein TolC
LVLLLPVACSTRYYRDSADREVYETLDAKARQVAGLEVDFDLTAPADPALDALATHSETTAIFGPGADLEQGARILTLESAFDLAFRHNRNHQRQKEIAYLEALNLTLSRHRFTPIFGGGAQARYDEQVREVESGVDALTRDRTLSGGGFLTADYLLRTGGRLTAAFTTDFLRLVGGNAELLTSSAVSATLVQPLWRGAGYRVAMESLTQAERDLLYQLREFTRFRQQFAVEIASQYYGVLQNRDQVRNAWVAYQNAGRNAERERALFDEGQTTLTSLGQFEQSELRNEISWVDAIRSYRQNLDTFKITLGLPTQERLMLDPAELERLRIVPLDIPLEDSMDIALATRLDFFNERDAVEDAARQVGIAANGLRPDIDLLLTGGLQSSQGSGFHYPDPDLPHWSAGLTIEAPFDRKAERNTYRAALIQWEQARRQFSLAEDLIRLELQEDWRALDQAGQNHRISEKSVELSERRLEEQQILYDLGKGLARDLLDAQDDLTEAQNGRTDALVAYTINRLQLLKDMGILSLRTDGQLANANTVTPTP